MFIRAGKEEQELCVIGWAAVSDLARRAVIEELIVGVDVVDCSNAQIMGRADPI